MGIAFCILAHKNPAQVARLLRAISHPENLVFLHYERRAPRDEHEAVARMAGEMPNVRLLPSRAILWGRFSQVAAQLEGLRRALDAREPWSHFITLTGQDFPLLPQARMAEELEAADGRSFLSFFDPFETALWGNAAERLERVCLDSSGLERLLALPGVGRRLRRLFGWQNRMPCVPWVRRRRPGWFRYWGGANHVILSHGAADYIANDPQANRIIRWLRHSAHPDESVFQSVLLNGPLADTVVNDDRRAIRWAREGDPSPLTLGMADLPWVREARVEGKLFVRKVDLETDARLVDELENDLGW